MADAKPAVARALSFWILKANETVSGASACVLPNTRARVIAAAPIAPATFCSVLAAGAGEAPSVPRPQIDVAAAPSGERVSIECTILEPA